MEQNGNSTTPNFWVEKTIVNGRIDRNEGPYSLGKVIWSPQKAKKNRDIYWQMREIKAGDVVFHFVDNERLDSFSIATESVDSSFKGIKGTDWANRPAYLIRLKNNQKISPVISRKDFLESDIYKNAITDLLKKEQGLFFNTKFNLNQGSYITKAPLKLIQIWNDIFINKTGKELNENWKLEPLFMEKQEPTIKSTLPKNGFLIIDNAFNAFQSANLQFSKGLLGRFISSIITKPFVILTGLSGSGKTKLAQIFATWLCVNNSQYKIIPVGSDWTNREPLLGYPNAIEKGYYIKPDNGVLDLIIEASKLENSNKPYFLILDEMNLSHVERYFADFLSAMESNESIPLHDDSGEWQDGIPAKIYIPNNLFIIGTVNVDETTYMFSPKVLDRAGVIEFRITEEEMKQFLLNPVKLNLYGIQGAGANAAKEFVDMSTSEYKEFENQNEITNMLNKFFTELKKAGAEFGYRSATEIFRFTAVYKTLSPNTRAQEIIDAAVIQKLLPKLHGSRRKLIPILTALAGLCLKNPTEVEIILKEEKKSDYCDDNRVILPLSLEKIIRMYNRAINDGFTSFAEA